ncbi:MAG TPA: hypothetical protein VJA26_12785 [Gammaproteobacteria bacterium]|nr:hypothetical protein [Gammaproteobacteria bacterium]
MRASNTDRVRPVVSLQEFFKDSVERAMQKQRVAADDHTAYYLVNLLTLFARPEPLLDDRKPLALMLADAADASDSQERNFRLQRVGDTSLFVAGFFGESFARRLVGIDYYIDIGGLAYGSLSANVRGTLRGRIFGAVFAELAQKFREFVDVLAEVRDAARGADDVDILRLYDVWLRTKSARAARLLRSCGVEPNQALDAQMRH